VARNNTRRNTGSINLDDLFRPGSHARKIAERLMTGKPMSRNQLVDGLNTSVTTVNRVVSTLQKAGAITTREIGGDGKQAIFRLVEVTTPKAERPYLQLGERVRVVAAGLSGDDMLIDTAIGKYIYRGAVRGVITNVNIGGYATVVGIERVDDTLANVRFEVHGTTIGDRTVVLESVRNVTQ
jgi:DNA-binding Lrp family transcriptional regulator